MLQSWIDCATAIELVTVVLCGWEASRQKRALPTVQPEAADASCPTRTVHNMNSPERKEDTVKPLRSNGIT